MENPNYERLIKLAEEIFDVRNDPEQLNINPQIMERLREIHPATISEFRDENGPVAWVLIIPTTSELMNKFLICDINEQELFDMTPIGNKYDSVYLCSALVLEEYRRKGITKQLAISAIEKIREENPLSSLFVWAFSDEGDKTAENIAHTVGLPLHKRIRADEN
jgi:GNAT superfamily N-acetyltransferase